MTELEQFIQKLEGYQRSHHGATQNTVIAMLKAAMKELQGVVEYWNGAPESAVDAIETVADRAHNCLAHLNTLAAEALGTKGDEHDT